MVTGRHFPQSGLYGYRTTLPTVWSLWLPDDTSQVWSLWLPDDTSHSLVSMVTGRHFPQSGLYGYRTTLPTVWAIWLLDDTSHSLGDIQGYRHYLSRVWGPSGERVLSEHLSWRVGSLDLVSSQRKGSCLTIVSYVEIY